MYLVFFIRIACMWQAWIVGIPKTSYENMYNYSITPALAHLTRCMWKSCLYVPVSIWKAGIVTGDGLTLS